MGLCNSNGVQRGKSYHRHLFSTSTPPPPLLLLLSCLSLRGGEGGGGNKKAQIVFSCRVFAWDCRELCIYIMSCLRLTRRRNGKEKEEDQNC